jgi:hypothetical protein
MLSNNLRRIYMRSRFVKLVIGIAITTVTIGAVGCGSKSQTQSGAKKPKEIRFDFATYNVESLVLK